jgi:hypothetical protein
LVWRQLATQVASPDQSDPRYWAMQLLVTQPLASLPTVVMFTIMSAESVQAPGVPLPLDDAEVLEPVPVLPLVVVVVVTVELVVELVTVELVELAPLLLLLVSLLDVLDPVPVELLLEH